MLIFQTECDNYIKINYITNAVNKLFPKIRKSKFTTKYFIEKILDCDLNFQSWSAYGKIMVKYMESNKFHHKYINEIYLKWCRAGVFKIAYANMINDNLEYDSKNLSLNTDVTCISNMYGIENVGVNPEYAKKNVTKIGFLNTSLNNTPLSFCIIDNKNIYKTHKTLCHDKSSVQNLIDDICVPIDKKAKIEINADKAYISTEIYHYNDTKINVKTPQRTKSIKQTNKQIKNIVKKINDERIKSENFKLKYGSASKNLLKSQQKISIFDNKKKQLNEYLIENKNKKEIKSKRYLIENYFCKIKKIPKLNLRTDKSKIAFIGTIFIGLIYNYKINH